MRILAYMTKKVHRAMWDNMLSLVNALCDLGHEVAPCDINSPEDYAILCEFLEHPDSFDMSIGFNSVGMEWYINGSSQPVYPYKDIDLPHVSVMLDEPFNQYVAGYNVPCKKHIVTYLDRSDLRALEFMYPGKRMEKLFLPLGGTMKSDHHGALLAPKEYDVVVSAGNWLGDDIEPQWHEMGLKKGIVAILDDVVDVMRNYPISLMMAFENVLNARGMYGQEYLKALKPYFWPVMRYIKPWRRQQMMRCLVEAGIKVDVFGGGWDKVPFADSLMIHGSVPYAEMLDVMTKTKVLVQDEALFNDGAHDRVFTGMLNGAVVVSEYSSYLDELFENKRDLFMFDWQDTRKQLEIIPQLLNDEPYRLSIAMNAYSKAVKNHTWKNRAERIMETVEIFG